jgi:hypothetical protein
VKRYLYLIIASYICPNFSSSFAFLPLSFDDFCLHMVTEIDRAPFTRFYQTESERIKQLSELKREAALAEFRETGLCSLEVRHPAWAKQIKDHLQKGIDKKQNIDKQLNSFLLYYGMHEIYWMQSGAQRASMWVKFRSRCSDIGNRVTTWFNSSKFFSTWRNEKMNRS